MRRADVLTELRPWPGDLESARRYAAIRHPALIRVTVQKSSDPAGSSAIAVHAVDATPGADEALSGPLDAADAAQVLGEIALGLAALHEAELTHGAISPAAIRSLPSGSVRLTGVARPAAGADDRWADIAALGSTIRTMTAGDLPAELAGLLDAMAGKTPPRAADVARTALSFAVPSYALPASTRAGQNAVAPITSASTETLAEAGAGERDRERARLRSQRRTRNQMIAVAALVVIVGAIALRALDRGGGVAVPDVVGRTRAAAVAAMTSAGFNSAFTTVQTRCQKPGTVAAESPSSGTKLRPGRVVTLQIAAAPNSTANLGSVRCGPDRRGGSDGR